MTSAAHPTAPQTPRELVTLWSTTAAARLLAEQAKPGTLSGTELNRLGELLINAATWLTDDAAAAKKQARIDATTAFKQTPEYAAMSAMDRISAVSAL